ncbi:MAG: FAD-dependent oxidoreductase [Pirellulaceae bacterium]|nr:FAD-dependent oxidoreductase [Pirellulaceae bacterium]
MAQRIGRRGFLQVGAVTAAGLGLAACSKAGEQPPAATGRVAEPAREVPVVESADVVVCGAGPAGVAAALAAARTGASVRLIESHGQLGGIWTTGLLSWIIDAGHKGGLMRQVVERLDARAAVFGETPWNRQGSMPYDAEQMKLVLEQACLKAGVKVRLHTRVAAAVKDGRRVTHCITESKSGREAFAARALVDCTGDGDLAALAGCGFDFGRPAEGPGSAGPDRAGETQPFSLLMLVTGIDPQAAAEFYERTGRAWAAPKDALLAEFKRAGVEPTYGRPTIFKIHHDLYAWMINHEYGCRGIDAQEVTDATLRARAELHQLIDALRLLGDPWKNVKIVATAAQIGVREGRRIHGRYTVSVDDMLNGVKHDDAVCRVTFGIDVHSTNQRHSTGIEGQGVKRSTQPYDIPLRSLIARDADGLLLAGRCISGDFLAHSSYRVTGNAVAMGEAAGAAAAWAAQHDCLPHEVKWEDVASSLTAT